MEEPITVSSDDPIISKLNFKPYLNMVKRRVVPFAPDDDEPQTTDVLTPWGASIPVKKGDLIVSEIDKPDDHWPVDADIFDKTYMMIEPGICIKRAVTLLVPLVDITNGDKEQLVTVNTMEGPVTVKAGDFLLAKGVKGEIWPYPKDKADEIMRPAE